MSTQQKWLVAGGVFLLLYYAGIFPQFFWLLNALTGGLSSLILSSFLPLAAVGGFAWWALTRDARRKARAQRAYSASVEKLLAQFGATQAERTTAIDRQFDERTGSISFSIDQPGLESPYHVKTEISRSLVSMSQRDREALRAALHIRNSGYQVSDLNTWLQAVGLIWGEGKGTHYEGFVLDGERDKGDIADAITKRHPVKADAAVDLVMTELEKAAEKHPDDPVIKSLTTRLLGSGPILDPSGALKPATLEALPAHALIIGQDEKNPAQLWTFEGEGSLITVAPPGSGKTQCHVLPNLLTWRGPAVVLDIKGEIHAATSGWRKKNVGPVYRFSPLDPESSHSYNPLAAVSDDPDHVWEDSRFLADMLIVPNPQAKDPFWERRARDIVTAAVAVTVRSKPPLARTMGAILNILHGLEWNQFIILLQASEIETMKRAGQSLGELESKVRDGVLQTALASMSAWEGNRITRATARSDWQPLDLRAGGNPTVYICIKPNEIDSYASMLRVIIAQHIRVLTAHRPERGAHPILFVLDELPRLRNMPPVEEALEIGRDYLIKLWMFTQSLGQLENAYADPKGMVGNCALRMFMNPSLFDNTAQKLSDDMGYRESPIDGSRMKRVEADVLAGPEYKDSVIVMAGRAAPARVGKHYAHTDPELARRMEIAPAMPERSDSNAR